MSRQIVPANIPVMGEIVKIRLSNEMGGTAIIEEHNQKNSNALKISLHGR